MIKAVVVGTGEVASSCAIHFANEGLEVSIVGRDMAKLEYMRRRRRSPALLGGNNKIPRRVKIYHIDDIEESIEGATFVLNATNSEGIMPVFTRLADCGVGKTIYPPIVSVTKAVEPETGRTISQIANEMLGKDVPYIYFGIVGFARDFANRRGVSAVIASEYPKALESLRAILEKCGPYRSTIVTTDTENAQRLGAVKNIDAIGVGILDASFLRLSKLSLLERLINVLFNLVPINPRVREGEVRELLLFFKQQLRLIEDLGGDLGSLSEDWDEFNLLSTSKDLLRIAARAVQEINRFGGKFGEVLAFNDKHARIKNSLIQICKEREMTELLQKTGGDERLVSVGVDDLELSTAGGRNHLAGMIIAMKGLDAVNLKTVEGVASSSGIENFCQQNGLYLPVSHVVNEVLSKKLRPDVAAQQLKDLAS